MSRTVAALLVVAAAALGGAAPSLSGCGSYDPDEVTRAHCPSLGHVDPPSEFFLVSPLLERRCGTLDCHGQLARPLRIYGRGGLRRVDNLTQEGLDEYSNPALAQKNKTFPGEGGKDTTEQEVADNRRSACGLEPELMTEIVEKAASGAQTSVKQLLLLQKPLGLQQHKGEIQLVEGSASYDCISGWIRGKLDKKQCEKAAKEP
ncbi:MAG: hypothetical protein HY744_05445 [Deltaproteobacteria bacterium]|nr:hypothetical protein [Deltaproteobacteria bacterium]